MDVLDRIRALPFHETTSSILTEISQLDIESNRRQWGAAAFALGVSVHLCLFSRGEWDLTAGTIFKGYAWIFVLINAILLFATESPDLTSAVAIFANAFFLLVTHGLGILLSICVYRRWFHRLRSFPGPALASVTSFDMTFKTLTSHQSEVLQRYHQVYGDYVRICPNKLSIIDPAAVAAIYGRTSPASKGVFVNTHPRANLNMTRDKVEHTRRRKFWDRAFTTASLRDRVPIVDKHAERLLSQLRTRTGSNMDVSKWIALFSFDVLFDIGFGLDKHSLERGQEDFYMSCAKFFMELTGSVMHVPWLLYFCSWSPALNTRTAAFGKYSTDIVNDRLSKPGDRGDLFSIISRSYDELSGASAKDRDNLAGDADLLVLAGADSIANTIANLIYELAGSSAAQNALRHEFAGIQNFEEFQIHGSTQLDAFINESLRIHPPAPAGHERMTPPEGLRIGERYIPGNVSVFIPHYSLHRDARFFEKPSSFIPERWTTRPELIKNPDAYIPFQAGKNKCAGKGLALMEIRTIIYLILTEFTIHYGSKDTKAEFVDGRSDKWLLDFGELNIVLRNLKKQ